MKYFTSLFLIVIFLAACNPPIENEEHIQAENLEANATVDFHVVPVPEEYAGLTNPIIVDDESIQRGQDAFLIYCAVCHGDTGLGDGPGAVGLDPQVPVLTQTHHLSSDDFLYFRIRDGGLIEPFNSAMPAWEDILDKRTIWDLINYIHTLESGSNGIHETK